MKGNFLGAGSKFELTYNFSWPSWIIRGYFTRCGSSPQAIEAFRHKWQLCWKSLSILSIMCSTGCDDVSSPVVCFCFAVVKIGLQTRDFSSALRQQSRTF